MEKRQTCLDLSNFTIKRKLTILSETNHSFSNSNTHHLDEVLIYLGLVGSVLDGYLTCSVIVQKQKKLLPFWKPLILLLRVVITILMRSWCSLDWLVMDDNSLARDIPQAPQSFIYLFVYQATYTTLGLTCARNKMNRVSGMDSRSFWGTYPGILSDTPTECVTQCANVLISEMNTRHHAKH